MVRDLLDNQIRLSAHVDVGPGAVEQLAEDGVQRLLLRAHLLVTGLLSVAVNVSSTHGVLSLQSGNEPLEDTLSAVLGVLALRDGGEELGVLTPVGRELGERGGGQDDCVHRRGRSYELQSASIVSYAGKRAAQQTAGKTRRQQCAHQHRLAGNSNSQGGAVIDDRSPVMWASCLMKLVHPAFCSGGTSAPDEPFASVDDLRGFGWSWWCA